jgi:hypothetical protein
MADTMGNAFMQGQLAVGAVGAAQDQLVPGTPAPPADGGVATPPLPTGAVIAHRGDVTSGDRRGMTVTTNLRTASARLEDLRGGYIDEQVREVSASGSLRGLGQIESDHARVGPDMIDTHAVPTPRRAVGDRLVHQTFVYSNPDQHVAATTVPNAGFAIHYVVENLTAGVDGVDPMWQLTVSKVGAEATAGGTTSSAGEGTAQSLPIPLGGGRRGARSDAEE